MVIIGYEILISKDFAKDLKRMIRSGRLDLREKIKFIFNELKKDPRKKRPRVDIKLISSRGESVYRIRIGDYRMIYEVDEENKLIMVTKIFQRGKGYKKCIVVSARL